MCHVMGICMKIVNSVRRSLQRRILRAQLEENESDYGDFLHHGDVLMSRRKQRSAFDQVSEFDRGKIVAYRDIVDYLSGKSVVVLDETKQL
ncbi:hypothetical protein TNCV_433341 [Trichonephila clavipes]|nr:hypothetical protein TNCV_433341 [Trichonephila clavipes]